MCVAGSVGRDGGFEVADRFVIVTSHRTMRHRRFGPHAGGRAAEITRCGQGRRNRTPGASAETARPRRAAPKPHARAERPKPHARVRAAETTRPGQSGRNRTPGQSGRNHTPGAERPKPHARGMQCGRIHTPGAERPKPALYRLYNGASRSRSQAYHTPFDWLIGTVTMEEYPN